MSAVVMMLYTSGVMKSNSNIVEFFITWENQSLLQALGAQYSEDFGGLPRISKRVPYQDVKEIRIFNTKKTEYVGALPTTTSAKAVPTVSFRKLKDRGKEVTYVDIIPVEYDSVADTYYLIHYLELEIIVEKSKQNSKSSLRTSENAANSVLSDGEWYRIPVTTSGVYKIDYAYLKNAGLNMTGFNPKNIKLYGNGGGMLPQANNAERPDDLLENAIFIDGQADGIFNEEDYLLFYGQDANDHQLLDDGTLVYEKNFYSDTTFYFLTVANEEGQRISERADLGNDHPPINTFDDYLIYEKDEDNIINSGRMWFGDKFDFTSTYDLSFDFTDLSPNSELSVTSSIMGQTYEESSLKLFANTAPLGTQTITTIAEGSYREKGSMQTETFSIDASQLPVAEKLTIRLSYSPVGTKLSKAYLDYLIIRGVRTLKLFGSQTHFRSQQSTQNAISTFAMANVMSNTRIWDITNPLQPIEQKNAHSGNILTFGTITGELKEFIAFNDSDYLVPEKAVKIPNQNLHATQGIDVLIVTHPDFLSEVQRLANLRENHDGYAVGVVTTQQIYNEFSSGKQDVTAIRDYIKLVYNKGSDEDRLQNVLLFGKGSFDYKDRIDRNTNFVPIYSSRNSLHPINSYSSDDYFGFMDENEGEWKEPSSNDAMDVGVGRLPVKSAEEARIVVDKLIRYATDSKTLGSWRNELVFVADDGDNNLHQRHADKLATLVDTSSTTFNVNKVYIDAYQQVESSIGETSPGAIEALEQAIEKGGLIVNFTGHGSPTRWTSETILNISSISELENKNRLPLFVTATCEFGRHENPKLISGAEYLLHNPAGGAIGLVTTSRPVYSSTNFVLNEAFYHNVFEKIEGKYQTLGEIFRKTKNQSLNGSVNRNFSLLGDPSMTLAYAKDEIRIIADEEAYQPGDTLKAREKVNLKGEVLSDDGTINTSFNGKLIATVFDKPTEIITYGHEDPKMRFQSRDNVVFRGEVSVVDGAFEVEFIVPKNIQYAFDKGKISMYAYEATTLLDAAGSNIEFVVGGEGQDYDQDNTPPEIELFINDASFVAGGITGPDIALVALLRDESGISTSNSDDGEELTIILDDTLQVNAGNYYVAASDTYKSGWVTYPFKNLSIGTHNIKVQVWDVHGNFNEGEIEFHVIDGNEINIENLRNYPNPFREQSTFTLEHNRAGDDLEISIEVISTTGRLIKKISYIIEDSPTRITGLEWDSSEQNGSNILGGVYIFKVGVRSLVDGSKKVANHKFVIIN
jgi:hypothetical protein